MILQADRRFLPCRVLGKQRRRLGCVLRALQRDARYRQREKDSGVHLSRQRLGYLRWRADGGERPEPVQFKLQSQENEHARRGHDDCGALFWTGYFCVCAFLDVRGVIMCAVCLSLLRACFTRLINVSCNC